MAVPYQRRVVFSTYVIPEVIYQETLEEGTELEEGADASAFNKTFGTIFNVAEGGVGKALGAKSRGDEVAIQADQISDAWTTNNDGIFWDSVPSYHNWEDYAYWIGGPYVTGPLVLRPYSGVQAGLQNTIFLWVRNMGDNKMVLSLDGGVTYPIILLSFASFCARLNNINSDLIMVNKTEEGDTLVEYLVAF